MFFYYTDYIFYQRILENSWILIKKNRDIVNTNTFCSVLFEGLEILTTNSGNF